MEDYKAWIPKEYLAQYYATGTVTEDERGILRFIADFLKEKQLRFTEMLEIGCGPTIHHAMPFVPHVDRLYMADYLEGNLGEIQKVLDEEQAHDWQPYISGALDLEGNNAIAVEERLDTFRSKVSGLLSCNVFDIDPLASGKVFPLVTSFYCLECVTSSKETWSQVMSNVLSLVEPRGWVILSALRNAEKYLVGGKQFPATSIDEQDMKTALAVNGFVPETVNVQVCNSTWGDEGFDTIMVCCARKGMGS